LNLEKLFEAQKKLDERIVKEKGLENEDLLDKRILALLVELGELANEYRGFKFWSENQKPNTDVCDFCDGNKTVYAVNRELNISTPVKDCPVCRRSGKRDVNPLLEEYVDCLHFILSIGLELGCTFNKIAKQKSRTVTLQFIDSFHATAILFESIESDWDEDEKLENFENVVAGFLGLGEMLGFTWEQIEQGYYEKNRINHGRQKNGY